MVLQPRLAAQPIRQHRHWGEPRLSMHQVRKVEAMTGSKKTPRDPWQVGAKVRWVRCLERRPVAVLDKDILTIKARVAPLAVSLEEAPWLDVAPVPIGFLELVIEEGPPMTLLDRIIAAEGPDRALDWAIVAALGKADFYHRYAKEPLKYKGLVPLYTASIDAALTLLPEGWRPYIAQIASGDWSVSLTCDGQDDLHCKANAATPALGLLAAIMKIGDL